MNIYSISIGILLVLGVGGIVYWQTSSPLNSADSGVTQSTGGVSTGAVEREDEDEEENEDGGTTSGNGAPSTAGTVITAATVAQHGSRASCWSIINGSVYDLTSWIPKHPGGEQAIVQLCGIDGSAKFNGQHGGQAKQATVLAGFKIGVTQ